MNKAVGWKSMTSEQRSRMWDKKKKKKDGGNPAGAGNWEHHKKFYLQPTAHRNL